MSERITAEQARSPRRPTPPGPAEDGTPVAEFAWSDDVVGIGYLREEVGLVSGRHAPQRSQRTYSRGATGASVGP
jgi:hypothetical protein